MPGNVAVYQLRSYAAVGKGETGMEDEHEQDTFTVVNEWHIGIRA